MHAHYVFNILNMFKYYNVITTNDHVAQDISFCSTHEPNMLTFVKYIVPHKYLNQLYNDGLNHNLTLVVW